MKVYLIYEEDAWHTKGSGELLRVADSPRNATQQQRPMELRKSNLEICATLDKVSVVGKVTNLT